jgi:CHAT domain-containing protein
VNAFGDSILETTRQHLKELYDQFVRPLESYLHRQHLVIVPHGLLHYVPFQGLFDGEKYLIDKFRISYAPSATVYNLCHRRPENNHGPALVMGIADAVAPLIREEATAVAKIIPGAQLYLDSNATLEVLRGKGGQSRIIHIATHGYFRQDQPMFSGMRLGDSMLSLMDIHQLKLPADLITLSGCVTGVSAVTGGDELLGLVRGLFHAGAKSALVTLWDVHDRSTLEFMTSFYQGLLSGADKAKALQEAAWKVRETHPHPYYWAPFNLVGNI